MNKYTFLSVWLILCSFTSAYSQSNFRKGFIITNANDTVLGFVDFRSDNINSKICKFKPQLNDPETHYVPGQIYGFRFVDDQKFYVSKTVTIDDVNIDVFLEFLVQGMKNLYYLPWANGYYFFENEDGTLISVTKKSDQIINNKVIVDNKFKGMLNYIFRDSPLLSKTDKAKFDRKSMIDLTLTYHDKMCETGESCVLFENDYKKRYGKLSALFYSGFELNAIKYSSYQMPTMYSLSPIIGATLGISSPRVYKPLWFVVDLNFSRLVGACDFSYLNTTDYYQYEFAATKANLSYGLKYDFLINNQHLYVVAKTGNSALLRMKKTLQVDYYAFTDEFKTDVLKNVNFPVYYESADLGLGIERETAKNNFLALELSYHYQRNSVDKLHTIQFKVGYNFQ